MKTLTTIACAAAVLTALPAFAATAPRVGAPDDGRMTQGPPGRVLFMQQGCYLCHGMAGQGSIMSGPSLTPLKLDDAAFRRYVRRPTGAMPPYTGKVLSDPDLGAIEAYVRALPQPKPYGSIPLLAKAAPPAP